MAAGCAPTAQERSNELSRDGIAYFARGSYEPARQTFQAALALEPADPDLLYNVGRCHEQLGDSAKAESYFGQCLKADPNHAECRHALVVMYIRTGRRDDAVRMVEDWLQREPRLADAYAEDGSLWRQFHDLPRACGRFQQALALDPHNNRALVEYGEVFEESKRPDQPDVQARLVALKNAGVGRPHPD
jgi:tetratricopeptide (TPR) repeat protein